MRSLASGQLDFFDLDFSFFIRALYFRDVRLCRDFQIVLRGVPCWMWGGAMDVRTESRDGIPRVPVHSHSFRYNLLKNEHNHFTHPRNPSVYVCVWVCVGGGVANISPFPAGLYTVSVIRFPFKCCPSLNILAPDWKCTCENVYSVDCILSKNRLTRLYHDSWEPLYWHCTAEVFIAAADITVLLPHRPARLGWNSIAP